MTDEIETPYDHPRMPLDYITFPAQKTAYLRGVADSEELGIHAMKLRLTLDSMESMARWWVLEPSRIYNARYRITEILDALIRESGVGK